MVLMLARSKDTDISGRTAPSEPREASCAAVPSQPIQEVHTLVRNLRLGINEARKLFIEGYNLKLNKTACRKLISNAGVIFNLLILTDLITQS